MTPQEKVWLSQAEAAEYLGVTDRTIRNYISRGTLPGYRIEGSRIVRVKRVDLEALLERMPTVGSNGD